MEAISVGEPYVVATTSKVNARSGPGSDYENVGALGTGSVVYVTKKSDNGKWGYVAASRPAGEETWGETSACWVSLSYCVAGSPSRWLTTAGSLHLRKDADVNSCSLAKLPKGTQVTVTEMVKQGGYTWGRVAYAKDPGDEWYMREGWVALEYCVKNEN